MKRDTCQQASPFLTAKRGDSVPPRTLRVRGSLIMTPGLLLRGLHMGRFVAILLLGAFCLPAQTNRGGISGTVQDQSGAVIPGAKVVVTNQRTNEARHITVTGSGTFLVPDLDPVSYNVSVEAAGFKKQLVEGVKVDTASIASVLITLEPGAVQTQV